MSLSDVDEWRTVLADALDQTGGPLTDEERRWADDVLGAGQAEAKKHRRRTPAA
jgi:hypothetical protein